MPNTDSRFFTNEEETLLDRFEDSLSDTDTKFFDVLVGYFRASGFLEIYNHLEDIDKIQIIVGLDLDETSVDIIESGQKAMDLSSKQRKDKYLEQEVEDITKNESKEVEKGLRKFIEYIESGKLEIRMHPNKNIHTKLYILRETEESSDEGRVITGSSNFSASGLKNNMEFNVELKDPRDVKFAKYKFDQLWEEAEDVEISDEYIDKIEKETWFNDSITPYELYLKFLYEYFGPKRINRDQEDDEMSLPDDFIKLQYQLDAVEELQDKLDKYDGAYLADVVGLGKTFITAMLAKEVNEKFLILSPSRLTEYWENTFEQFDAWGKAFSHSYGGLKNLLENRNIDNYTHVVIDEAHKFRNESNKTYEMLEQIVADKNVILVSATPLNNEPMDIGSQIFLFQDKFRSDLPGLKNLYRFFKDQQRRIENIDRQENPTEYLNAAQNAAEKIRKRVLSELMVRRTRKEVEENYEEDLKQRGVEFPEIKQPHEQEYIFNEEENDLFQDTLKSLKSLSYARYKPLHDLKSNKLKDGSQVASQANIKGFMKSLLIKRLDSSFYAFRNSLKRFIKSYEQFIEMYKRGVVYISKDIDVFELMELDDSEKIFEKFQEKRESGKKGQHYNAEDFKPELMEKLQSDKKEIEELYDRWKKIDRDPKLVEFKHQLEHEENLSDPDKKIIIFTESKESAKYLGEKLSEEYGDEVLTVHGSSNTSKYNKVKRNFNPDADNQEDEVRILVATDAFSEGINMHRANIIVNYDIPWNPTVILQRVGRVNRVGAEHDEVHIYNYFPADETEEAIGLKQKAMSKIQAFHEALGEDAQYLTKEEEFSPKGIYEKSNSKEFLESGEEEDEFSRSAYLTEIREVRDDNFELYEKVKDLPQKARSAKALSDKSEQLLTYFEVGKMAKIFVSDSGEEIDFKTAADLLQADPETDRKKIPKEKFYELKETNRKNFRAEIKSDEHESDNNQSGRSNREYILKQLNALTDSDIFSEQNHDYLKDVELAVEVGINKETESNLKKGLKDATEPKEKLQAIKQNIDDKLVASKKKKEKEREKKAQNKKVILSEYFTK